MTPTHRRALVTASTCRLHWIPTCRVFVATACAALLAVPLRAEIVSFTGQASTQLTQIVSGVAGDPLVDSAQDPNDPLPLQVVSQTLADQLGVQVGERYVLFGQGSQGVKIPDARRSPLDRVQPERGQRPGQRRDGALVGLGLPRRRHGRSEPNQRRESDKRGRHAPRARRPPAGRRDE